MGERKNYVIIDTAGRAENVKDGWGWFEILDHVVMVVSSAGSQNPLPDKLLLNGTMIIRGNLHDTAWRFSKFRNDALGEAQRKIREAYPEPATPDRASTKGGDDAG